MSFILDALNRAEQERKLGITPGLDSITATPSASPRPRWPWLVGILLAINIVGLAWLLVDNTDVSPAQPTPVTTPRSFVVPMQQQPVGKIPAPIPAKPFVERRVDTVEASRYGATTPVHELNTPVENIAPARTQEVEAANVVVEAEPTALLAPVVYELGELDTAMRRNLGPVVINMHIYDDDPAQRFVFINMKKYVEGALIPNAGTLFEITPEGVVLNYQSKRVRIVPGQ
ncbi:MAG TPA: hypothetical protein EYN73_06300 [Chromatiaceae bacterium]|jgi:general secretion pathway protein B|nr:hypothetical protein [Chromatiaceae bacterium]HIB84674.1 hypothetical protein [Chromatiaceae bacterium]